MTEVMYSLAIKKIGLRPKKKQVKTKCKTLKGCPQCEKHGGTKVTLSRSPPQNSTPAHRRRWKHIKADNDRIIVRFKYDWSIAHQNCVREFSENKSCAKESLLCCKYTQT